MAKGNKVRHTIIYAKRVEFLASLLVTSKVHADLVKTSIAHPLPINQTATPIYTPASRREYLDTTADIA